MNGTNRSIEGARQGDGPAVYRCVRCDVDLYPVSSMMQPSQASGHLQSPVKETTRVNKGDLMMPKELHVDQHLQLKP